MDVSLSNIPLGGADWMDYSTGGEEEEEGVGARAIDLEKTFIIS